MMMSAPEAAAWVADRFDEDGIDYAIGGALALIAWGIPRATAYVDISAFVERTSLPRVLDALERAGVMVPADAAANIERIGMFRGLLGRIPIDVFTSEHPHQHAMRERRCLLELGEGRSRWFVSREDLVVLKVLYERPKDELDAGSVRVGSHRPRRRVRRGVAREDGAGRRPPLRDAGAPARASVVVPES
jgi:hypothetical protein